VQHRATEGEWQENIGGSKTQFGYANKIQRRHHFVARAPEGRQKLMWGKKKKSKEGGNVTVGPLGGGDRTGRKGQWCFWGGKTGMRRGGSA